MRKCSCWALGPDSGPGGGDWGPRTGVQRSRAQGRFLPPPLVKAPRWGGACPLGGACPYARAGERVSVALTETEGKGDSHASWTSRATENPLHYSWCVEREGMAARQREGVEVSCSHLAAACVPGLRQALPLRTQEPPHQTKAVTPHLQKRLRRRNSESLVQGSTASEGLGLEGELGCVRPRVSLQGAVALRRDSGGVWTDPVRTGRKQSSCPAAPTQGLGLSLRMRTWGCEGRKGLGRG